jgi:hypothetical protein
VQRIDLTQVLRFHNIRDIKETLRKGEGSSGGATADFITIIIVRLLLWEGIHSGGRLQQPMPAIV